MNPSPEFTPVNVPARIADLEFSYLRPADFQVLTLPEERPDFQNPTTFFPLQVAMANYGMVLFSAAARPAFEDGSIEDWAEFLSREAKVEVISINRGVVGGLPAMVVDARQPSDAGVIRLRTAFIEDGKRLLNLSIIAPEAIWPSVEPTLQLTLSSFRLAEPRGTTTPLRRADLERSRAAAAPAPEENEASEQPAASESDEATAPVVAALSAAELALEETMATFAPDHPVNVRLRDRKVGLVPRVLTVQAKERYGRLGAGALEAILDVPFGWHVLDDGRRTLVFDAGGRIQVSLNLRRAEQGVDALLDGIEAEALSEQPQLETRRMEFGSELPGLLLENYRDGDDVLAQAFGVRQLRSDDLLHVARVTAAPDDLPRALALATWLLRSLNVPVAAAR